jgi:site-specific recombinase XerD
MIALRPPGILRYMYNGNVQITEFRPPGQHVSKDLAKPTQRIVTTASGTRASTDEQLLESWLASLGSSHTRLNFETTARRFLAALPAGGVRAAKVEDVRDAVEVITSGLSDATARQYTLRVKSLLSYARKLGYTRFNAAATIKVRSDAGSRGAKLSKRIITPTQVSLLIRAARTRRDRVLLKVGYSGGLHVSELVSLTWSDVLERDEGRVQLSVTGKGGKVRQVLLPAIVSRALLALRGDAGANDPLFPSREGGGQLTVRAVRAMVKRAAARAGIDEETASRISPHWLRHAHASHAIDGGASLPEVQETLGHANVATTSGYLHARPESSSGLRLDEGGFLR